MPTGFGRWVFLRATLARVVHFLQTELADTGHTMNAAPFDGAELSNKIARLAEERGWNQEDFARIANLNRHTVRQILNGGPKRRLRNATVGQCAEALGLTVNELRTLPLDRLLARMHGKPPADEEALKFLREKSTLPEFITWMERNANRAAEFRADEIQELLDLQAAGGPMERLGVDHVVELIERRRELMFKVRLIAKSDELPFLEQLVDLIHEKVTRLKS
jgi:transcriptional regulator with XRE-family HTH domain